MTNAPANSAKDSKAGLVSLGIFVFVAVTEILFFAVTLFNISALPTGTAEAFGFVRQAATVLCGTQALHAVGMVAAIPGTIQQTRKRRLAVLGLLFNAEPIALSWLG